MVIACAGDDDGYEVMLPVAMTTIRIKINLTAMMKMTMIVQLW